MPLENIGKSIVASLPRSEAESLCRYLNYHRVPALVCASQCGDVCGVAVCSESLDDALRLVRGYETCHRPDLRRRPPVITVITEKVSDLTTSAILFTVCGGAVILISALRLTHVVRFRSLLPEQFGTVSTVLTYLELALGALFLFFGIRSLVRARRARSCASTESAMTLRILTWLLGTYAPEDLDRLAEAEEAGDDPCDTRRRVISGCIRREFSIEDEKYLEYLTEEAYAALYHTRKFSERSAR